MPPLISNTNVGTVSLTETTGTSNGMGFMVTCKYKITFCQQVWTLRTNHSEMYSMSMLKSGGGTSVF